LKVLGLTGGVGMGKSASTALLQQRGVAVVDTDVLARDLVEPGQPALAEIVQTFGAEMAGDDGRLRRDILARHVFADPQARQQLEGILHPRIRSAWKQQIEQWRSDGRPHAVVVIPLLFETDAQAEFDCTICVACTAATQQQRLVHRGWRQPQISQRIAAQIPTEQKIARSDFVVWTEGDMDVHAAQLDKILARL
jgi:dephospho-CoA kinase